MKYILCKLAQTTTEVGNNTDEIIELSIKDWPMGAQESADGTEGNLPIRGGRKPTPFVKKLRRILRGIRRDGTGRIALIR